MKSSVFSRVVLLWVLCLSASPAAAAEPPAILVLGDSLSAAYGMPRAEGWVGLLEQRLERRGCPYRIVNASISGETTSGALNRLPELLQRHRPAVVIVELGGNDGLRGIPVAEFRANLAAMIGQSQRAGARVLLTGIRLPVNYGPDYTQKFFAVYSDLAKKHGTALVPFFMEGVALDPALMQADGIHPNAAGQSRLLANVWPHLAPLLDCVAPAA